MLTWRRPPAVWSRRQCRARPLTQLPGRLPFLSRPRPWRLSRLTTCSREQASSLDRSCDTRAYQSVPAANGLAKATTCSPEQASCLDRFCGTRAYQWSTVGHDTVATRPPPFSAAGLAAEVPKRLDRYSGEDGADPTEPNIPAWDFSFHEIAGCACSPGWIWSMWLSPHKCPPKSKSDSLVRSVGSGVPPPTGRRPKRFHGQKSRPSGDLAVTLPDGPCRTRAAPRGGQCIVGSRSSPQLSRSLAPPG